MQISIGDYFYLKHRYDKQICLWLLRHQIPMSRLHQKPTILKS